MKMKTILIALAAFLIYKKLSKAPEGSGNDVNQMSRAGLQLSFGNPSAMPMVDRSAISQG